MVHFMLCFAFGVIFQLNYLTVSFFKLNTKSRYCSCLMNSYAYLMFEVSLCIVS